ncbi:hypothetical protein O181_060484 [Austropuccinia psidii MF-1]|uniref:Uncharacterized protein n=1 Tax=Austropuccinia psidii MF-1 TaxID=1389203 RepID=A0A9Q3EGC4_9BASI|nr:hypothetical protein [Austropuccinia psidii MF-1]
MCIGVEARESLSELSGDWSSGQTFRGKTKYQCHQKTKEFCTFEATKASLDQGDDSINVEIEHNDNEGPQMEGPLELNETIQDGSPLPLLKILMHPKKVKSLNINQWVKLLVI